MPKKHRYKTYIGHLAVGIGFILTVSLTMKGYGRYAEIGWYIFVFGMGYNWGYDNGRFETHTSEDISPKMKMSLIEKLTPRANKEEK